ncbi:MAG: PA2778 family cysteine peptidase, partial [Steroidobacteraceae bacterium]
LSLALPGCAGSPPLAEGLSRDAPRSIELSATPFFPQDEYQCGPAALAMLLRASGVEVTPATVAPEVFIPGRRGSLQIELIGAARRHGRLPYPLAATAHELVAELDAGRAVLVLQNLGATQLPIWHYAVLIGYDSERNLAILRSGRKERLEMRWQRFAGTWHRGGRFAFTVLAPGEIPAHAEATRYVEAAAGLEAAGQRRAAALAYDSAIARWPEQAHAWLGRGNIAYADGDLDAAADSYLHAIRLAPQDAAARNNLAQVLADAGCLAEARRQIERAAALAGESALANAIAETRAKIDALPAPASGCSLPDRAWPD